MNLSYKHAVESQSFSSSLLEKVIRSNDEGDQPSYTRHGGNSGGGGGGWSQTKGSISSDRVETHRSIADRKVGTNRRKFETEAVKTERSGAALRTDRSDSTSTISIRNESSRGGFFWTSYDQAELKPKSPALIGLKNLKPIRTCTDRLEKTQRYDYIDNSRTMSDSRLREGFRSSSKAKPDAPSPTRSFENAKCLAAKMYGELKNAKQPISPGGKLKRFISSLFSKRSSTNKSEKVREHERGAQSLRMTQAPVATCSSASSYYRSCLSNKSPSSAKRSVRFCPVNIVIDDDGHQKQQRQYHSNPRLVLSATSCNQEQNLQFQKSDLSGENCRSEVQSDIRELLKKYQKTRVLNIYDKFRVEDGNGVGGDDDDNDGGSCASSDLFELDHIGGNANQAIHDELPVYESTQLHSNNPGICSGSDSHKDGGTYDRMTEQVKVNRWKSKLPSLVSVIAGSPNFDIVSCPLVCD